MQLFLGRFKDSVAILGMRFAAPYRNMLLQDWVGSNLNLVLAKEELDETERSNCLSNCISFVCSLSGELSLCIPQTRSSFTYSKQQRRIPDI